jgi:hypothetical protein
MENELAKKRRNVDGAALRQLMRESRGEIETGDEKDPGVRGALQKRRELVPGKLMIGYECSISVADVDRVAAAVKANGGKILMERTTIRTVGHLIFFEDPEGNVAGAMQYDPKAE